MLSGLQKKYSTYSIAKEVSLTIIGEQIIIFLVHVDAEHMSGYLMHLKPFAMFASH